MSPPFYLKVQELSRTVSYFSSFCHIYITFLFLILLHDYNELGVPSPLFSMRASPFSLHLRIVEIILAYCHGEATLQIIIQVPHVK